MSRDAPAESAADYDHLYRAGLAHVQKLAEETWTDYNDHDPGVTILQLLCYALTDIAYRIEHPIEDILAPAPDTGEDAPSDAFYTGEEILTCEPLTINDYRKLVYDRVGPMKNAWLHPSDASEIKGLYDVRLQPWRQDDSEDQHDSRYLQSATAALLRRHRNIGEDFASVEVMKPLNLTLEAEIHVGFDDKPEDILAHALFAAGDDLIPFPQVTNIDTRFQQGVPADEIFVGPKLRHGDIDDTHLEPLPPAVTLERLVSIIRNVPSVVNVRNVTVTARAADGAQTEYTMVPPKPIFLPRDHIPYLDVASSVDRLRVIRDGSPQSIDAESVQKSFDHLVRQRLDRELYARKRMHDIDYRQLPWGRHRDLQRYASIQHEFPIAYGLGSYGIPELLIRRFADASQDRLRHEIQVKQLKAYLVFFEQLLANQLSQLANVPRLFSLDEDVDQTYFWQAATDAPRIGSVLGWREEQADEGDGDADASEGIERYRRGLERIVSRHDPRLDRRERVLDHLLARFNERFEDDKLELLRREQARRRYSGERDKVRIRWKREFLREYVSLSGGRGGGIDYSVPAGYGIDFKAPADTSAEDEPAQTRVVLRARHDISSRDRRNARYRQMLTLGEDASSYRLGPYGNRLLLVDGDGETIAYTPQPVSLEVGTESAIAEIASLVAHIRSSPEHARGEHVDFSDPVHCALERRVSLLAGCTSDVYLLEHVLLRPALARAAEPHGWPAERFSLAASFFFHGWQPRFQSLDYRQFAEGVVRGNCPAHVELQCYWLSKEDMADFKTLYYEWRAAKADACRPPAEDDTARTQILEQVDALAARLRRFVDAQRDRRDREGGSR